MSRGVCEKEGREGSRASGGKRMQLAWRVAVPVGEKCVSLFKATVMMCLSAMRNIGWQERGELYFYFYHSMRCTRGGKVMFSDAVVS